MDVSEPLPKGRRVTQSVAADLASFFLFLVVLFFPPEWRRPAGPHPSG